MNALGYMPLNENGEYIGPAVSDVVHRIDGIIASLVAGEIDCNVVSVQLQNMRDSVFNQKHIKAA